MYGGLAVVFVMMVGGLIIDQVRGPDRSPAPELTAEGQPYAEALQERLREPGPPWAGYDGLSSLEAECVAPDWVMIVGPGNLDAEGYAPAEFSENPAEASRIAGLDWDQAQRILASYKRCGAAPLDAMRAIVADDVDRPEGVTDEDIECLTTNLEEGTVDRAFILALTQAVATSDLDITRDVRNLAARCEPPG